VYPPGVSAARGIACPLRNSDDTLVKHQHAHDTHHGSYLSERVCLCVLGGVTGPRLARKPIAARHTALLLFIGGCCVLCSVGGSIFVKMGRLEGVLPGGFRSTEF